MNGVAHCFRGPESIRQTKVEPASLEVNAKAGVGLLVSAPWAGPLVMLAVGAVASAVNARYASKAGFGVRSCASRPALPQRMQMSA